MGYFNTISATPGGALAFRTGSARKEQQFVWFDRTTGREVSRVGEVDDRAPSQISPSPDGGHLVLGRRGPSGADLWLLEIRRGLLTRFTTDPSEDIFPVWSRDGSRIVFTSNRNGGFALYQKRTTGPSSEELLLPGQAAETFALDADSRFLIYQQRDTTNGWDIWVLPFDGGKPSPLIHTEADERDGQLSPDGKGIAYVSNESGRVEVYVQSFPTPGPGPGTQSVDERRDAGAMASRRPRAVLRHVRSTTHGGSRSRRVERQGPRGRRCRSPFRDAGWPCAQSRTGSGLRGVGRWAAISHEYHRSEFKSHADSARAELAAPPVDAADFR